MLLLVLFSASVPATADEEPSQAIEPIRLQLKWLHQFQFAGYYAALEQGYYREAGFDVTLLQHPLNRSPVEVLLDGSADYVVMGSDVLVHRAEGAPLVALAAITQHDPLALLVTNSSGIQHPEDLRGKRVMLDYGAHDASILAMLKQAGLEQGDYQLQQTSYNPMDLAQGSTDAFNAYITDQGFLLDEQGVGNHYLHPSRYGIDFYSDILVTTESLIERSPEQVRRFREASLKGWAYAMSHTEELIDLILAKYNTQNRSRAHLQYEAAQMREMVQPLLVELGYMHHERWSHIRDTFQNLGFLKSAPAINEILYQGHLQARENILQKALFPAVLVLLALLMIIFLVGLWNRKLKQQVRRRTEQLERAQMRTELILESMDEGLVVVNKDHQIQRTNRKLERLTGKSSEMLAGQPLEQIFEEDSGALFDAARTLCGANGDLIPVQVSGAKLSAEEEEAGGAVLVVHDLRDRVRAERQEQYAAFQAGVANMGASVLHNIGNVVTGMGGHILHIDHSLSMVQRLTEWLRKVEQEQEAEGSTEEKLQQQLEQSHKVIEGTASTLEKIVEEIGEREVLDKLEHGIRHIGEVISIQQSAARPVIHATQFNLKSMVGDVRGLIEDRFEKYEAHFEVNLDPALGNVLLPRNPLIQLLLNLLKNSLEAIQERMDADSDWRGHVQLSFKRQNGSRFTLTVEDDGCGAGAEGLKQLFKTGYTTKQTGSGYGLHSAANFVQSIDGEIRAESDGPGRGMRIVVTLPLALNKSVGER